jgi:SAM-dependent methyltransferase
MRTIRLGRQFDVVLIHDAIMYLTDEPSLRAALENAARHTRPGGVMVLLPDCVAETFESSTSQGGEDAPDGRGLRYLDWSWDPDPTDTKFETVYAFLLRDAGGEVRAELDRHTLGLFPRATWVKLLEDNGLSVTVHQDPWNRDVFLARRAGSSNSTPADVARGAGVPAGQTP